MRQLQILFLRISIIALLLTGCSNIRGDGAIYFEESRTLYTTPAYPYISTIPIPDDTTIITCDDGWSWNRADVTPAYIAISCFTPQGKIVYTEYGKYIKW